MSPPATVTKSPTPWISTARSLVLVLVVLALSACATSTAADLRAGVPSPPIGDTEGAVPEGGHGSIHVDEGDSRGFERVAKPLAAVPEGGHGSMHVDEGDSRGFEWVAKPLAAAPIGFERVAGVAGADGAAVETPLPVSITIESLKIDAVVVAVGVNPDLSLEVPPAAQAGWYRFGAVPGAEGSAVLAGHIAFDGVDGVFRHLVDAEVGATVMIGFDDATSRRFRITTVTEYLKQDLPAELFAETGEPTIALITCGGTFDPDLRSYDSNVVAIAVPT